MMGRRLVRLLRAPLAVGLGLAVVLACTALPGGPPGTPEGPPLPATLHREGVC